MCCAGIVHRDVKRENVLLHAGPSGARIQLADLGFAAVCAPGQRLTDACGTTECMAPELFVPSPSYDHAVDMFSAGVLLSEALTAISCLEGQTGKASGRNHAVKQFACYEICTNDAFVRHTHLIIILWPLSWIIF